MAKIQRKMPPTILARICFQATLVHKYLRSSAVWEKMNLGHSLSLKSFLQRVLGDGRVDVDEYDHQKIEDSSDYTQHG